MNKLQKFLNANNYNFYFIIGFFYLCTILSFYFNLDPNGGANLDYLNQKRISRIFSENFLKTLFIFDQFSTRHSPVLLSILSIFEKISVPDLYIRLIAFHFCMILPLLFYKLLRLRFNEFGTINTLLLTSIIFLSPTFISLAIWPDSRIYGIIFFVISLIYYSKFETQNNLNDALKCTFWYAISSYFSLNFAIFSIFFILKFFNFFKFKKEIFFLILFNIILALPALVYTFSLESFFFFKSAIPGKDFDLRDSLNFSNKILIISSIILFYLIPFFLSKLVKINFNNLKIIFFSILIVFICSFYFDYDPNYTGGGIFFKISQKIFNNNFTFFIISILALIVILNLSKLNPYNGLIIILLILSNIQFSIYHKYYDPLLFILFFSIFDLNLNNKKIKKIKFGYFYLFSLLFLALNYIKQVL